MATTAAVYDERSKSAIFVGMDGYPSAMEAELKRLIEGGHREELFEVGDYLMLGANPDTTTVGFGNLAPKIGVIYPTQGERLTVEHDSYTHAPMFYDGAEIASPDYKYTIGADDSVIVHHKY